MINSISKRYVAIASGQVHLRETASVVGKPPLYCLHATAYSGRTFEPIMRTIAERRRVVAPDTPGYGASDRPGERWDIVRYAQALGQAIDAAGDSYVDLFGYHTGAFLATELAAQRPDLVRSLVLVGVPLFLGDARKEKLATLGKAMRLSDSLAQFDERWSFFVTGRTSGVSLNQGFANFVDELIAYPHGWWAHDAAFRYEAETRLGLVSQPTLILNPDNHLAAASRAAGALMPNCRVVELSHLGNAVLDIAGPELAERIDAFLVAPGG
jgi:pimeloyl-ACP methyl ester carboxylesterase